jgi:hypothetical protein
LFLYAVLHVQGQTSASTAAEAAAAEVWCQVLNLQHVGMTDDFFQRGGTSLTAIRLAHQLSKRLGLQVRIADVFQHRTISALLQALSVAAAAEACEPSAASSGVCLGRAPKLVACDWSNTDMRPLSYQQTQMYTLHQMKIGDLSFSELFVWRFEGILDALVLQQALGRMTDRHEVLRTALRAGPEGSLYGHVLPAGSVIVPVIVKEAACSSSSLDQLMQSENQPFDLGQPPFMRATLVLPAAEGAAVDAEPSLLLLAVHHVAVDGISMGLLCAELTRTYNALKAGNEVVLVAAKVCFERWQWQIPPCSNISGLLLCAATMQSTTAQAKETVIFCNSVC